MPEDELTGIELVPLTKNINRKVFDCGVAPLNEYFRRFARQNQDNFLGKHFVAIDTNDDQSIPLGFYTLSAGQVAFENFPKDAVKGIPRYPIPVVRIGRLAVDLSMAKKGLGGYLLMSAIEHTKNISSEIGIYALVVDAKNENAALFYEHFGFIPYNNRESLALPIQTILSV